MTLLSSIASSTASSTSQIVLFLLEDVLETEEERAKLDRVDDKIRFWLEHPSEYRRLSLTSIVELEHLARLCDYDFTDAAYGGRYKYHKAARFDLRYISELRSLLLCS